MLFIILTNFQEKSDYLLIEKIFGKIKALTFTSDNNSKEVESETDAHIGRGISSIRAVVENRLPDWIGEGGTVSEAV